MSLAALRTALAAALWTAERAMAQEPGGTPLAEAHRGAWAAALDLDRCAAAPDATLAACRIAAETWRREAVAEGERCVAANLPHLVPYYTARAAALGALRLRCDDLLGQRADDDDDGAYLPIP